jgi:hypothetical protein
MKLKTKFGKNINLYLSNEVISKLNKLTNNKSAYIEALINKEFYKENEKE